MNTQEKNIYRFQDACVYIKNGASDFEDIGISRYIRLAVKTGEVKENSNLRSCFVSIIYRELSQEVSDKLKELCKKDVTLFIDNETEGFYFPEAVVIGVYTGNDTEDISRKYIAFDLNVLPQSAPFNVASLPAETGYEKGNGNYINPYYITIPK